jgi:O-antigen ligase
MQLFANIFIFFTFFVVPFLGGNHLTLYYVSIDRFWIEGVFGVFLVIAITLSFLKDKTLPTGFFRYCFLFLPLFVLSIISLSYAWNAFNTLLWISILVWCAGCVYLYAIAPNKDICLIGLIAGAAFVSTSAILQLKILFPNLLSAFQQGLNAQVLREQSGIPFASYMYHNILGGYLAFVFPLALYFGIYKKRMLSLAAAVVIAVGVVITSTRIGLGITFLMFLITSIILIFEKRKQDLLKIGLVGLIIVVSVLAVLYQGEKKNDITGANVIIIQKTKAVSADLSTLNTRTDIWKNAFNAYKNSPVTGYGAGSFEYAYRKYFDGNSYTGAAHSSLVKIAVELGVIGVVCFLFFLVGVSLATRKLLKEPRYLFILLSLCSGFLFGLIDFSFEVKSHIITFFVLSAVFFFPVSMISHYDTRMRKTDGRDLGIFLTLTLCLLANLYFTIRVNEFKASVQNGDHLMENGLPVNALYSYRDATEIMPLSTEGFTKSLSALWTIYPVEVIRESKEAMFKEMKEYINILEGRGDKDSELYLVLGKSHALMGDIEKAEKYFRLALDYYPSSGYYVHKIASYYAENGKNEAAMAVIRSFDRFIEKHRGPHNPRGIFVYKIRDLEADLEFRRGNGTKAVHIARRNLQDAKNGVFIITSVRAKEYVPREKLLAYLSERNRFFESECFRGQK